MCRVIGCAGGEREMQPRADSGRKSPTPRNCVSPLWVGQKPVTGSAEGGFGALSNTKSRVRVGVGVSVRFETPRRHQAAIATPALRPSPKRSQATVVILILILLGLLPSPSSNIESSKFLELSNQFRKRRQTIHQFLKLDVLRLRQESRVHMRSFQHGDSKFF